MELLKRFSNTGNRRIIAIQSGLVLLMSAAAAFSLYSFIEIWSLLVFAGLLIAGAVTIMVQRLGVFPFSLLTLFASLPSIINHNIIDIGMQSYKGLNYGERAQPVYENIIPASSFPVALVIGLFLVFGYLSFSYLHSVQKEYRSMTSGEADISEVEISVIRNTNLISIILAASVIITAIVVVIMILVQPGLGNYLKDYPWSIMVFGLGSVLLLGAFVYRIGMQNKTETL
jgi:hypothetical protein